MVGSRRGVRLPRFLSGFDRRVWLMLWAMLVFRFGQGMYYPFATIYFHNVVGIPLSSVGVGLGALAVASVAAGFVCGPLADRHGRKPLMVFALSGSAATFAAFSFVEGFYGFLAVSVAAGLFGPGVFNAARNAMIADVTPSGERSRAYGLVRVGGNVGWALGPATASFVAAAAAGGTAGSYRALFLCTAALAALVAAVVAFRVEESAPAGAAEAGSGPAGASGLGKALADRSLVVLLGSGFLLYYVFAQDWQALPVYAKNFVGLSDVQIGLFLSANGLMVVLLQIPVSHLIDRTSKVGALVVGAGLFALSAATLLLTESFVGILLAFAGFFTLAEMVLEVAGNALAADLSPAHLRGTYLALFSTCFGAARGVSPVVAGSLLDARMPDLLWSLQIAAAGLAAAGLVALGALLRSRKEPAAT